MDHSTLTDLVLLKILNSRLRRVDRPENLAEDIARTIEAQQEIDKMLSYRVERKAVTAAELIKERSRELDRMATSISEARTALGNKPLWPR